MAWFFFFFSSSQTILSEVQGRSSCITENKVPAITLLFNILQQWFSQSNSHKFSESQAIVIFCLPLSVVTSLSEIHFPMDQYEIMLVSDRPFGLQGSMLYGSTTHNLSKSMNHLISDTS